MENAIILDVWLPVVGVWPDIFPVVRVLGDLRAGKLLYQTRLELLCRVNLVANRSVGDNGTALGKSGVKYCDDLVGA